MTNLVDFGLVFVCAWMCVCVCVDSISSGSIVISLLISVGPSNLSVKHIFISFVHFSNANTPVQTTDLIRLDGI